MKIFILDKSKITKFNLPEKIEDSFLIPYISYETGKENLVTVEAKGENWQLKSNGNANVFNSRNVIDSIQLENYSSYSLKISGQSENVTLIALPSKDEETYKLNVQNLSSISIGSSGNCNICYKNDLTAEIHAEIKFVNNDWYIAGSSNDSYRTYINGERVLTAKLNIGDIIFINGLKIIWMKNFIKINNPKRRVSVKGLTAFSEDISNENTKYTQVSDEDTNVELYKEDEYFYHTPRLVPTIDPVEIIIDDPPLGPKEEELPFILTLGSSLTMGASSIMMIFSLYSSISSGRNLIMIIPQAIMTVCMIIGSLLMPRILSAYQKKRKKKREKEILTKYDAYLNNINKKIENSLTQQLQILRENNHTVTECINIIKNRNKNLWLREIIDEDFLRVRLGIGNIRSYISVNAEEEHFTVDESTLKDRVNELGKKSQVLNSAPITLDLTEKILLSFVFNCSYKNDYINSIITQLLALHSPLELKIVLFTTEKNKKIWEYVKYLPHCWSDDKSQRFFATSTDEYKDISSYLEDELRNRAENFDSNDRDKSTQIFRACYPYYLIIIDDYQSVKNIGIIEQIQKYNGNLGFSIICCSDSMKNLPNRCDKFIEIGEKESCIFSKELSSQSQIIFTAEYEKNLDMQPISVKLANVPFVGKEGATALPTSLSFLEMFGVGKIEQLNILNRWKTNNPVLSLSTPIGVHSNLETFKLDLHEKFHGPHGLIAGSTGSGKSEFIITYILSMCVNYHPYEVQFVLIDYKGGGLAGAFENKETGIKIPHLVGTITNLDTAEMNRTLVSISSELKRRQKKFNEVKDKLNESTIDIYKYQKFYREGLIDEPMAHLFIISDEFAELKSQQPEFLNELVSTARIGRSLGVHLILATQKPSGVVNDQIWSNSKFKVCLKVQDRSDSNEMLKRPDAASIKETGRFYLQVGYDDYFDIGQSGYGGVKYVPTDKILKRYDDSINFVSNTGNIIKSINDLAKKDETNDLGEQLTNVVKYIYNLSIKENLVTKNLWFDRIPDQIYLDDIKKKYNYKPYPYYINPTIGEYDNPAEQLQGILNLSISDGNTLIYGNTGSGKENLLTTIIWSSCVEHTPDEVNLYIIDCGAETLKMFYKFPHVGDIATIDDEEKIYNILNFANEEIERRKDAYVDYAGSYKNYIENSNSKDPLMVFIINNYEIFSETYSKLSELITTLYRDGSKYGVMFIITCTTTTSIRSRVSQYFNNKIALQLSQVGDYRDLLGAPRGLIPYKNFGRGLIAKNGTAYEFQTAIITDLKQLNNVIKSAAEQLNNGYISRAKKIKTVPKIVTIDDVKNDNIKLSEVPIGYSIKTKEIYKYNFTNTKFNIITGNNVPKSFMFIIALIKLISKIPNINFKIVDMVSSLNENFENTTIIKSDFEKQFALINNEIANENSSNKINLYMIIGASEISNLSPNIKQIVNNLFMASNLFKKSYFILVESYNELKNLQLENWYQSQVDNSTGIWIGEDIGTQMAIYTNDLSLEDKRQDYEFMCVSVEKGDCTFIKYVCNTGDENEK